MRQDPARLAQLRRLLILDSSPERDFDRITELLARTLDVPIAMVNLLDEERDWFKSCVGLPMTESAAATSFCEAFFGSQEDLIVVADTTLDARFASHPLVTGLPHVRFYAAARLRVRGQTVGTLCAYGMKARQLPAESVKYLQTLASSVVELLMERAVQAAR
jgi:GAF domain-containing protein